MSNVVLVSLPVVDVDVPVSPPVVDVSPVVLVSSSVVVSFTPLVPASSVSAAVELLEDSLLDPSLLLPSEPLDSELPLELPVVVDSLLELDASASVEDEDDEAEELPPSPDAVSSPHPPSARPSSNAGKAVAWTVVIEDESQWGQRGSSARIKRWQRRQGVRRDMGKLLF